MGGVKNNYRYKTNIVISGFRREMVENCVLMGFYAASSGNYLPIITTTRYIIPQKSADL